MSNPDAVSVVVRIERAIEERANAELKKAAIVRAQAASAEIRGLVLRSDEDAALLNDMVLRVKSGKKSAKAAMAGVLELPKKLEKIVRLAFDPIVKALEDGERTGAQKMNAWQSEKRRQAKEEEDRRRQEAIAAAEEQRTVDPHAPVMETAPVKPETTVRSDRGMSYTRKVPRAAIVNLAEVPEEWVTLKESLAKQAFRNRGADPITEHPDGGYVYKGVRFWNEEGVAFR